MQQVCLGIMRFCLAAWVGIAVFFVMVLIDLRQSNLFAPDALLNHPKVLFPLYYACEAATLGPALVCSLASLRNTRIGRSRKCTLVLLVFAAAGLALWDYGLIYRDLLAMMNGPIPLPPAFHLLHRMSRRLNEIIVTAVAVAAVLALVPQKSVDPK